MELKIYPECNVPSHPTYDEIHNRCEHIASLLTEHGEEFDLIVGLSRGGLLPGIIFSHLLNTPFKPLEYSSTKGKGDGLNSNSIPRWIIENEIPTRVLIVDDIADSGHTLNEIVDVFRGNNFRVLTATIYSKVSSVFIPDYSGYLIPESFGWIVFPFEKKD